MKQPKILLLDIETAPGKAYIWNLWDDNVPLERVIEPGRMLCWGAKWLGRRGVYYADERAGRAKMLCKLSALIEEADAVVSYNGDKFDLPRINGELALAGLPPLPPITSIDVLKTTRRMGFLSARLEYIGLLTKIGQKIKHAGFKLWKGCMDGDAKSWRKMRTYNLGDVRLLERAYLKFRPFMQSHPRLVPIHADRPNCRECGGTKVRFAGYYNTRRQRRRRFQCLAPGCGAWDHIPDKGDK